MILRIVAHDHERTLCFTQLHVDRLVRLRGLVPFIQQFAALRKQVGDDGTHFPDCEKVVQEFWDYDESNHAKAVQISHQFKSTRESKKQ